MSEPPQVENADHCDVVYVHVEDCEEPRSSDPDREEPRSSDPDREEPRSSEPDGTGPAVLVAPEGATLRDVLRDAGHSPYTRLTERVNCGGRGLCATCGVRLDDGPAPENWHDALAARWGYPRLSCQVTLDRDVRVRLPEKLLWGGRE
jgi:ferredoxin